MALRSFLVALAIAASAAAITPEQMIGAPRRSEAVLNPSGKVAFFRETRYSFQNHSRTSRWKLLYPNDKKVVALNLNTTEAFEIAWVPTSKGLSDTAIFYLNSTTNTDNHAITELWLSDAESISSRRYVGTFGGPVSGLKVAKPSSSQNVYHLLVNGIFDQDGRLFNQDATPKPRHTGRLYSDIFVRHWDSWITKNRYSVMRVKVTLPTAGSAAFDTFDSAASAAIQVHGPVVTRLESPVQPFGGPDDYDISPDGATVAFLAKSPGLPKANFTTSYIYVMPFDSHLAYPINDPATSAFTVDDRGASASPKFSHGGTMLAYAQQSKSTYESDKNKLFVVDIKNGTASNLRRLAHQWDRSVGQIEWDHTDNTILVSANDLAVNRIFAIPLNASTDFIPSSLTGNTSVAYFSIPPSSQSILVSASSVWSSRDYYTLQSGGGQTKVFSSTESDAELAGLTPESVSDFWFLNHEGDRLHALVVKPSNFDPNRSYPLAFIVHGGPQGANMNQWSTRWNFQVWADQGYIVVAPNPTGSTGFGQNLTDAIQGNWGGTPYSDLVRCWEQVRDELPHVNVSNGIAAGASYGGYMINWIQGQSLGRRFKALVTHDGLANTLNAYATEELWFIQQDFDGTLWDNREHYDRWNPLNYIEDWATPHFVVHNTLDYRLPESEGIALFNILQERGVPSRFLSFPDENHWVLGEENSLFWHTEIFNWINSYSGVGGQGLDAEAIHG